MSDKSIYYVYVYLRKDGTPFYVGKGKENRAFQKHHNVSEMPTKDRIVIIKDHISDREAKDLEIKLIAQHGRLDIGTGILENKNFGGAGGDNSKFIDYEKASTSHRNNVINGKHNWLGPESNKSRVEKGTHNFLGGEIQKINAKKMVEAGVHPFQIDNPQKRKFKCSITGEINTKSRFTRKARQQGFDYWPHKLILL